MVRRPKQTKMLFDKETIVSGDTFYGSANVGFRETGRRRYQSFAMELVGPGRCQLRCRNCYQAEAEHGPDGDMPEKFVGDALRQARECGFAEVVLMGGEPTLHPGLHGFVRLALEIGLVPIVVTNGIRLANAQYARSIALPGTTIVLHAPLSNAVQDEEVGARGYSAKLRQAYTNVTGLNGVVVVAEVVVIREFLPHIPDMHHWCREKRVVPFVEFNRSSNLGNPYSGAATPEEVLALFENLRQADPHPPDVLLPPAYGQTCTMSMTGVHVKNFGKGNYGGVFSCCAMTVRHGDLRTQPLTEILQSHSFQVLRDQDEWIYGPCRTCEYYSTCRGGCRGQASLTFGCVRASSPFCWHLPVEVRDSPSIMIPPTCAGCPLEGNPACHPRR